MFGKKMNTPMPSHVKRVRATLNDFVGSGRHEVSGAYIPWASSSLEEQNEIKSYIRRWAHEGYLDIIGDLDTWKADRVCYTMKNFVGAIEPLPENWLKKN
jgi:hypothetical protein